MIGDGTKGYQPTVYTTWANYFENIAIKNPTNDWKFTQEDVLVSLVWGSQILQKIAQEVRHSENSLISAEKLAVITKCYKGVVYPQLDFEAAWRPLLLSQHHDCWIVPYNGKPGDTWADKVITWTGTTNRIADSLTKADAISLANGRAIHGSKFITAYNTLGVSRNEPVAVDIPLEFQNKDLVILNAAGRLIPSQIIKDSSSAKPQIVFNAEVPSMGYNSYELKVQKNRRANNIGASVLKNGDSKIENDLYSIILDPKKGGTIKSLIAKKLNNKQFVDQTNPRSFNELRGNFYNDGGLHSSTENPASISIVETGTQRVKVKINGTIDGSPFTQWLTLSQGQRRIDMQVKIDWKGNPGIGEYTPPGTFKTTDPKKAFYNDKEKLLLLFPLNLQTQKVYKNAPFDVLQSRLKNTFFTSWDSIKNNIILNWVDITDKGGNYGVALLTDHTTNYTHGEDFPLGLTLAYSGVGLWGRDYRITAPTDVHYAIIPHAGKWDKSGIWTEGTKWNEPLITTVTNKMPTVRQKSLVEIQGKGLDVTAMSADGNDIIIRVFNAEGDDNPKKISFDCNAIKAELIELNGGKKQDLKLEKGTDGKTSVMVSMPRFGIRTIKLFDAVAAKY
jgi:alpha-mannosidase